jgi:hypothetical protein
MAAYNHFTVLSALIRVRVLQTGSGGGSIEPGAIVLGYSDTGTFMSSQTSYPGCIEHRSVLASGFYGGSTTTGNSFVLSGDLNICKLIHKTPQQVVEMANLRGSVASDPAEGYFFELGLFSFSSNPGAITVICDIEYDAIFTEPICTAGDS